jgi:hypothetical protein
VSSSIEDDGSLVQRVGTLRDALKDPKSPLRLTCYTVRLAADGKIEQMPAAPCTAKHNSEFAGIWNAAGEGYPRTGREWDRFHDACRSVIASYVGVPDDADLKYRAGVISLPAGQDVWRLGDRGVRCYLWLSDTTVTKSLKGRGPAAMPVRYQ